MSKIETLLSEREVTHGNFRGNAHIAKKDK